LNPPTHKKIFTNPNSWNTTYTTELTNFINNPSDIGTIWFSDSLAEEKILNFLRSAETDIPTPATWLDLGTGNGHLLFQVREMLADEGGRFVGVDYSDKSIELARAVAEERGLGGGDVEFVVWDVMQDGSSEAWVPGEGFDVVLDKGTFDAVSLSEEVGSEGRKVLEGYAQRVARLVRQGGLFLITSCNWTEEELRGIFEVGGGEFYNRAGSGGGKANGRVELAYHATIKYPSFTFGGRKGQTISSVCFQRKSVRKIGIIQIQEAT
jgi:EEF1A lysine methyltransferase 2